MNLSAVLFRNLGTKLLALAIACVAWYLLTGERRERISERSYRIPLSIVNIPRGTMIVSPLPDAVDVRVRGAFTPLRQLEPGKLEAVIDLLDATPGEKRYVLDNDDINVPRDVEVIAISPPEIRVVLDAIADKTLPDRGRRRGSSRTGDPGRRGDRRAAAGARGRAGQDPGPDEPDPDGARLGRGAGRVVPRLGDTGRPRPRACACARPRSSRCVSASRPPPELTPTPRSRRK